MRKAKNQLSYADQTSFLGRGLLEDEHLRVNQSAERVMLTLKERPLSMNVLTFSDADLECIMSAAHRISEKYWCLDDFDKRMKDSEIKADTKKLQKALKTCLSELKDLERPSRARINDLLRQSGDPRFGPNANSVTKVLESMQSMAQAISVIQKKQNKKQSEQRVFLTCQDVWKLREILTGKPFAATWDVIFERPFPQPSEADPSAYPMPEEKEVEYFKRPDPLFVQIFVQAIDQRITFSTIRKDLKELSKRRTKVDYSPDDASED